MDRAGRRDHVLLDHQASPCRSRRRTARPARSSPPCVTHDDWMFGMLSRYSRAMACVRRYSNAPASGKSAILWPGLHRPADERGEAAGFVLQVAEARQVLDALGVASRCGRTSSCRCDLPPSWCQTRHTSSHSSVEGLALRQLPCGRGRRGFRRRRRAGCRARRP